MFVLVIFSWMYLARLIRGQVLSLREREFVQAAQVIGAPTSRILFKELLPNLVAPIVVSISLTLPGFVAAEAGLSFLGIGITGFPSLGQTILRASDYYKNYPAVPLGTGVDRHRARGDAQPARRLGPRRLRPQDSSLTAHPFSERRTTNQGKGGLGHAVEETDHCRLRRGSADIGRMWRLRSDSPSASDNTFQTGGSAGSGQDANRKAPAARDRRRPEGRHRHASTASRA